MTAIPSGAAVPHHRWWIGVLLGSGILVNYFDRIALSVVGPQLEQEFGLTPAEMGLIFSVFFWSYAVRSRSCNSLQTELVNPWSGGYQIILQACRGNWSYARQSITERAAEVVTSTRSIAQRALRCVRCAAAGAAGQSLRLYTRMSSAPMPAEQPRRKGRRDTRPPVREHCRRTPRLRRRRVPARATAR
jgi:hypothetical protein